MTGRRVKMRRDPVSSCPIVVLRFPSEVLSTAGGCVRWVEYGCKNLRLAPPAAVS